MRYSRAFIPTLKEPPKDAVNPSHVLLTRAGHIRAVGSGLYQLLPLGMRVIQRISDIVRDEMNRAGAQEILMPALLPAEYFKESGRWDDFGDTLFRLKDRKKGDYHLGPTHEEAFTDLIRKTVRSYKRLPLTLYQIQPKFRDEPRPRAGLLRGREFLMKDAYSFDVREDKAKESYRTMRSAYQRIFERVGLDYRIVAANSGAMGGSTSAEFQVLAQTGEDHIVACEDCDYAANVEVKEAPTDDNEPCPRCGGTLKSFRGIEGGHIFILGTHYSQAMGAMYLDEIGKSHPIVMGCYGIGVSRLMAAAVEQHHDDSGMIWPVNIAPFVVTITILGTEAPAVEKAESLYREITDSGLQVLLDDRMERPGTKFKDADLLGVPLRVTVGARGLADGVVEVKVRSRPEEEKVPVGGAARAVLEKLKNITP